MLQQEVYDVFKRYFPHTVKHVECWFPNGRNSIRIRLKNHHDFIFTYNGKDDWNFETVNCFIERIKGGKSA